MPIVNLNGVIAGLQPPFPYVRTVATQAGIRSVDTWYGAGGAADTTLNGVVLSSTGGVITGQYYHVDPPGGVNTYLARYQATVAAASAVGCIAVLCDRLWHNGGITITSTSPQTIVSPTFPARDNNGATAGDGVLLGLSVSAATGAGTPSITVSYTNSAGTSGRTATNVEGLIASSTTAAFYRLGLQSGDAGVQSVQSITLGSSWTSGTINLVAYRVLTVLEVSALNTSVAVDAVSGGFPQIFNGAVPFLLINQLNTTGLTIFTTYQETQG